MGVFLNIFAVILLNMKSSNRFSIVRKNLMSVEGYSPYCGGENRCSMPRTEFNGKQFVCRECGWVSSFPAWFIGEYKRKWNLGEENV